MIKDRCKRFIDFLFQQRSPGKWVISFLAAWFLFLLLWGLLVWGLDPYIVFHPARGIRAAYRNSYAMIPGVLRNEKYDTVLIGSSMCQNFQLKEINGILGGDSVKATAPGLSGEDADQFLRTIFQSKQRALRKIVIGVDLWSYAGGRNGHWRDYHYLYGKKWSWEYFYSNDTMDAVLNLLITNLTPDGVNGADLEKDRNRMFGDKLWRFRFSQEVFEKSIRESRKYPPLLDDRCRSEIDRLLLSHLRAHPEVRFELFLPPYSAVFWSMLMDRDQLENYLQMRLYLAVETASMSNVRLHDFQSDRQIVANFDNYKDISHYSPEINSRILCAIAGGDHRIANASDMRLSNRQLQEIAERWMPYCHSLIGQKATER